MTTRTAARNVYDPRVRELIRATGNPDLFPELNIPRSTVSGWLQGAFKPAVGTESVSKTEIELHRRLGKLERRIQVLLAVLRLLLALVRVTGCRLTAERLPTGKAKSDILRAVAAARKTLSLGSTVRVLGLSLSRYHAWRRAERACDLTDRSSCPRTLPGQLTARETATTHEMVTADEYRHVPTTTLAVLAQRLGRVFASASTWSRLVRTRGWRRPRTRVYPAKPKVGLRATEPNQYWHIDVTVIRLLDGTKLYLHAVLDNFSRRILAWHLAEKLSPLTTCNMLAEAAKLLPTPPPAVAVIADSGVENVNSTVDDALGSGPLRRVLAQIDIVESNSLVEAWWRSLRHQWLYLNTLDTAAAVRRLVAFYVQQFNEVMPHSALNGRTPDEVYFGQAENIPAELAATRKVARDERLATNRALSCEACTASEPSAANLVSAA
jgi:putative transposase